ncbi:MAG: MazG nucleotide pyrophosphohydrolase domain-containing protein [Candidatus Calescibacterium sp.]|nr:hypothetical protein [Candidatus Calescibacterium sp.]MCX7972252.1 hypothetical protein [bacterium]MDW8195146.1 MazG nucleotide pyrophosphohydrolase domain-containing protein [Candidatus Calescibacterium sp.]
MYILGLADKKQILELYKIISTKIKKVVVFCKSFFLPDFLQSINENNIELTELFNIEEVKKIREIYPSYMDLIDAIRYKIKNIDSVWLYISTSINPLSSDFVAQEIDKPVCINSISVENIINRTLEFKHDFSYQLPYFKQLDFFYYHYHFQDLSYGMNFIIPNVPGMYVEDIKDKGYCVKASDAADIFSFIPEKVLTVTLFDLLWSVMIKLRYSCQWDKVQTSESIRNHLIEEAYEVLDSIEKNDPTKFKTELGDLLLQVIFHSQIQSDFKNFNFYDVVRSLVDKLISRHPHVFTENKTQDIEKILVDWEKIKIKENKTKVNTVDIPKSMPSLLKMYLLYRKVKRLKTESKFDNFVRKLIHDNFTGETQQILLKLHEFYINHSESFENILNNLAEIIMTRFNELESQEVRDL